MLLSHFIRRGYPTKLVTEAMRKAELQDRDALIAQNAPLNHNTKRLVTETHNNFYLVNTHNPTNPNLRKIIEENWPLLNKSKTTRFLRDAKLIFGLQRNKNLSDQLVLASTRTIDHNIPNMVHNPCQRSKNCCYCPLLNRTGILTSSVTGRRFCNLKNVNCQSSNLMYVITCRHCKIQYVGQTKNRIIKRFQGHMFDIAHNNDTTVSRHYNQCPKETPYLSNY